MNFLEEYHRWGFVVHPLAGPKETGPSPGKRPLIKQWQHLLKTPDNIEEYIKKGCNLGLVCGKVSNVTVIDFDHELFRAALFNGFEPETLMSRRTVGRGHVYFRYCPDLPAQKHHILGIEILADGNNAVLPPSTHASGEQYQWNNPGMQIIEMPAKLIENAKKLFQREKKLNSLINKCRPCFKKYWKDDTKICHGATARLFLGAFCSELSNKGADLDTIKMFAKIIYKNDYDEVITETEFRGWTQNNFKPWTCEKLAEQCTGFTECDGCKIEKSRPINENGNGAASYSQSSALIGYTASPDVELFHDDRQDPYARVKLNGKSIIMPVQGRQFKQWLTGQFFDDTGTAPGSDAVTGALNVIEAIACRKGKEHELFNRVAWSGGAVWYDLGDGSAVKIAAGSWEIVKDPPILFRHYTHMKAHDAERIHKDGNVKKVLDFVNLRTEEDRLLFVVHLISCFVPDIAHPIPVIYGDKGSSKTTVLKIEKDLVDPSVLAIISFPHNNQELVQKLYHHYFAPFDNLTGLSDSQSDALCRACTGEGTSKRALFTNEEDVIFNYKRCVALNGVNLVADKSDLLDRAILLRTERIPKEKRKTEEKLWRDFFDVKGEILGGIFSILAKAVAIKPNINLNELPRMADFMSWGCAISAALGDGVEAFKTAYFANIQSQNKEAIEASPVGDVITKFAEDGFMVKKNGVLDVGKNDRWEGTASELHTALEECAMSYKINIKSKTWPKSANVLTRRLNEIKTNLVEEGIGYDVVRDMTTRRLKLWLIPGNTVITVMSSLPQSADSVKHDDIEKKYRHNTVIAENPHNPHDDTYPSHDGIMTIPSCPTNQHAQSQHDDYDANDDISPCFLGAGEHPSLNIETCDICHHPINMGQDVEQGIPGQGRIHRECKYLPIQVRILQTIPNFMAIDNRLYGPFNPGDIANIPAINACGLVMRKAAERFCPAASSPGP